MFLAGGIVEIIAVPMAVFRLFRNEMCRTASNIIYTLAGSILFILFVGLYARTMMMGG
jgi:hypothetical protein